jgi:hypothetical protein
VSKPGPKGPRKAGRVRDRVLALRVEDRSVTEIAAVLAGEGTPVSAQTVWTILEAEGIGRLVRDDDTTRRGTPTRLDPVKARSVPSWPADTRLPCDHAGLLLLLPAMVELGLPDLVAAAGYPSTRALSAWQSVGTLLLAKCARKARVHHIDQMGSEFGDRTGRGRHVPHLADPPTRRRGLWQPGAHLARSWTKPAMAHRCRAGHPAPPTRRPQHETCPFQLKLPIDSVHGG